MKRKIVYIEEEKCNGCGLCAKACHEGAIQIINGKAKLIKDEYCDGLGDCLPHCPQNAITIIEREADSYNDEAVKEHQNNSCQMHENTHSCPGVASQSLSISSLSMDDAHPHQQPSQLAQWPCQIKLVPTIASYFENAHLLIAADCTAYTYASFHHDFMRKRVTLIGCPKLDGVNYSEKLIEIFKNNTIQSVTLIRMEVPCCGGLEWAVKNALSECGKMIPFSVRIISIHGELIEAY